MQHGAVVMLDALGFKGIWDRHPGGADAVLAKMKYLRTGIERLQTSHRQDFPVHVRCELISDTIALGVSPNPELWPKDERGPGFSDVMLITIAASLSCAACEMAFTGEPVLAYRGAISVGDFDMTEGFVIGRAVDDAAAHMELAEGALTWCTPTAYELLEEWKHALPHTRRTFALVPCVVPLKNGRTFLTYAVPPWRPTMPQHEKEAKAEALLATFKGGGLDVAIKKQNTRRFLEAAMNFHEDVAGTTGTSTRKA